MPAVLAASRPLVKPEAAPPCAGAAPPRPLVVALLGYGLIGRAVVDAAAAAEDRLHAEDLRVSWSGALVRDRDRPRPGRAIRLVTDAALLFDGPCDAVVEVLGGVEPARAIVGSALRRGLPVVTANKTLMAWHGPELRAIAAAHGGRLVCDAAVVAGVPFLGALARRPLFASARRIAGIVNGTTHYVLTAMDAGATFDAAIAEARALGYAEPDSRADTSGRDAAEKLCVLLHLAGCPDVRPADVPTVGLDTLAPWHLEGARRLGGTIKPVATASLDPDSAGAWAGPAFVHRSHLFARVTGVTNALALTGRGGQAVTFVGPGAGPDVTAMTVLDDLIEATTGAGGAPAAPARGGVINPASLRQPPPGEWFVAVEPGGGPGPAGVATRLAACHVPALQVVAVADRVVATTAAAPWHAVHRVAQKLRAAGARVTVFPCLQD
jgi:homoserine dehydrogenase